MLHGATSEALETHDIRSYRIGRRSITSIDRVARQVFQRSLVLSWVVDAAIFVSDPSDDSVGRLHPGLGLEPYPDRFARLQIPLDDLSLQLAPPEALPLDALHEKPHAAEYPAASVKSPSRSSAGSSSIPASRSAILYPRSLSAAS